MTNGVASSSNPLAGTLISSARAHRAPSRAAFIMGPLPLAWIEVAGRTTGAGLHVAMEIWFRVGLRGSDEVKVSLSYVARRFGFHRTSAARGLADLEAAGLVVVQRRPGRAPVVRVVREFTRPAADVEPGAVQLEPTRTASRAGRPGPGEAPSTANAEPPTLSEGAPAPLKRPGAWSEPVRVRT